MSIHYQPSIVTQFVLFVIAEVSILGFDPHKITKIELENGAVFVTLGSQALVVIPLIDIDMGGEDAGCTNPNTN